MTVIADIGNPVECSDREACQRLCIDFVHSIDHGLQERFLDLFTADGWFARATGRFDGREGLLRFLAGRPAGIVTRHLCTNIHIETVDATTARGVCSGLMFSASAVPGASFPHVSAAPRVVDYLDEFVRTPAGWRIKSREARLVFTLEQSS